MAQHRQPRIVRRPKPRRRVGESTVEARKQRLLSPPVKAAWARLLEAVTVPSGVNPALRFGPQDDDMGRFKVAVYEQVVSLLRDGKQARIRAFCRVAGKYPIGVLQENPFHWVLFALSRAGQGVRKIHPAQVRQLGLQLNYAHKHLIPPELLVGFLHQTGATGRKKQDFIAINPDAREWWFANYEARLRANDGGSQSVRMPDGLRHDDNFLSRAKA